jgi:nucleoside-diphosphate-sugar epimerase
VTTVLVTGGAGFIGSNLADRLLAEGHRVIAVDDLSTGRIANLGEARGYGKAYTFFNMDVRADGLLPLFERHRPEVVFHLAAQAGVIAIFASAMLGGEAPTIFGDGNQTRDYVFIDDVVHAFVQAVERGSGKLVNIGTGLETSVNGLYKLLADIIGFGEEPVKGALPAGELRRIALDISSASSALAWKPWTHLEDGLAETVAYMKGV